MSKIHPRFRFKRWLGKRGITRKFASKQMGVPYFHLILWLEGKGRISPEAAYRIELFTGGELRMIDILIPEWREITCRPWG